MAKLASKELIEQCKKREIPYYVDFDGLLFQKTSKDEFIKMFTEYILEEKHMESEIMQITCEEDFDPTNEDACIDYVYAGASQFVGGKSGLIYLIASKNYRTHVVDCNYDNFSYKRLKEAVTSTVNEFYKYAELGETPLYISY